MKRPDKYQNLALASLKGHWGEAVICSLIVFGAFIIYSTIGGTSHEDVNILRMLLSYAALFLLCRPLQMGYANAFRSALVDSNYAMSTNMINVAFRCYWHNVKTLFLKEIFIALWTLLFIIPGILMSLSYSMTKYIIKDYPSLSPKQAIDLSTKMMEGHRMQLFVLYLRFFGWMILCTLTVGVGFLWLAPYISSSTAAFYEDVKAEYEANNATVIEAPQESAL